MIYHKILETTDIRLRALEPEDIDLLYTWENNTDVWIISSTIAPFSRNILHIHRKQSFRHLYR